MLQNATDPHSLSNAASQPASSSIQDLLDRGELVKHREFWFTDGSLVLRADNTLFRVHISQLCRKTAFFRDLFALPQPPAAAAADGSHTTEERFDGCPVLVLYDSPEDVANLVKVIYDGPNFGINDRDDFNVLSGVLRLSSKYLVQEPTRAKALAHISTAWPSTLKAWDLREDLARLYEVQTGQSRGHRYANPIAVVNLAREIDADELLPSAFYELSRYTFTEIFEPAPGDPLEPPPSPFTSALGTPPTSAPVLPSAFAASPSSTAGRQHAITALIQNMEHAGPDPPRCPPSHRRSRSAQALALPGSPTGSPGPRRPVCATPAACRKDLGELIELATQHYLFDREQGCADPLYVAEELGQLKSAEFSDCVACARALEAWAARERERLWRAVPDWFRLR
ncbi:uncharacterized protein BXZ73DRAFT_109075 [Epithele typhae]|uniref:uncharacterized protein n=1 Tax=Epithele typhae TaxID=378194 RepID=UPI002007A7ED|nr:uncharacterized protein BXZ73DRAFT_109075 [Epithele typhae]KAH9910406.1 hypothetical protein BXZ73DRAFT_109075 [Epithele typhae]